MNNMTSPMQPKPLVNATCKLGKRGCFQDGRCHALGDCENKIVTNADKIRAMSDEELVKLFDYCPPAAICPESVCDCDACWLAWLKRPAEVTE